MSSCALEPHNFYLCKPFFHLFLQSQMSVHPYVIIIDIEIGKFLIVGGWILTNKISVYSLMLLLQLLIDTFHLFRQNENKYGTAKNWRCVNFIVMFLTTSTFINHGCLRRWSTLKRDDYVTHARTSFGICMRMLIFRQILDLGLTS